MKEITIAKTTSVTGLVKKDSNRETSVESFIDFVKKNSTCETTIHPPSTASDGTIIMMESKDVYVTFTLFPKDRETPQYIMFICSGEKQQQGFIELFAELSIIPYMNGPDKFYI